MLAVAGATLCALPGCSDRLSVLHPAGPAAATIAAIWWVLLAGSALIFVLVMALLALAFRRAAEGGSDTAQERGWIVGLGIVFPFGVLSALLVYGLVMGERLLPRPVPDLVTVGAEARQWAWRFTYADAPGRETENLLHIPVGRPVDVEITALDVIHSFWVPRLAGKLDAIPGHVNTLRIEAGAPGDYAGLSAEFSGAGYREHVFTVRVHDPASWSAFLAGGDTP